MRLALVTGESRGSGRAIVERLARDGYAIAFVYRRDGAAADDTAAAVRALGRRCFPLQAYLGEADSVDMYPVEEAGRQAFLYEIAGAMPSLCRHTSVILHVPGHSVRWWKRTGRLPS